MAIMETGSKKKDPKGGESFGSGRVAQWRRIPGERDRRWRSFATTRAIVVGNISKRFWGSQEKSASACIFHVIF